MSTKHYYSAIKNLCVNGIKFHPSTAPRNCSTYITSSEREQEMIEMSGAYKRGMIRCIKNENENKNANTNEKEKLPEGTYKVANLQEAREIIRKVCLERRLGIPSVPNKKAIENKAKELGISFIME